MRFRVCRTLLLTPFFTICPSLWSQAGEVYFPEGNSCSDNREAGTADLLPIEGFCQFAGRNGPAFITATGTGRVEQGFSLSTDAAYEADFDQDGSILSTYVDVQAVLRDSVWFDPAEYPDPIWVTFHWVIDTGQEAPPAGHGSGTGYTDWQHPECTFTDAGPQICDLTARVLPGSEHGMSYVIGLNSGIGYFTVGPASAGDSVLVEPTASAQLFSVDIFDDNHQPLSNPPTLISRYGYSYAPYSRLNKSVAPQ